MSRKFNVALLSSDDNFEKIIISSRRFERIIANVHDLNYRQFLRQRNVYINRENSSQELMRKTHKIIFRLRVSSEKNDLVI